MLSFLYCISLSAVAAHLVKRGREFADPSLSFTGNDWDCFSGRKKKLCKGSYEKKIFDIFWINHINISCSMRRKLITSFKIQLFSKVSSGQHCIL